MKPERVGIFGGAFDPIHIGHLFVASAIASEAGLDRVLFLPVGDPVHRAVHAPAANRRKMVALAIEGDARFDGKERGWYVYGPGSSHSPTVTGGTAYILYLLPDGAIEFTRR